MPNPVLFANIIESRSRLLQGFGKGADVDIEPLDLGVRTVDGRLWTDFVFTSTENLKQCEVGSVWAL